MSRLLVVFAVFALILSPLAFSQQQIEKKQAEKKKAEKKKAASSQDWGRFNTGAKRDLDKIEKKSAKDKAK